MASKIKHDPDIYSHAHDNEGATISDEDGSIIDTADLELKYIECIDPTIAMKLKVAGIISV
jgi:hypothetical protein